MTTPVLEHLRNPFNLRNLRFLLICACIPRPLPAQTHAFESFTPTLAVTAGLGVQKWLWGRRLRAGVAARNLFDVCEVTHPEGGSARRSFIVAAEAWLP